MQEAGSQGQGCVALLAHSTYATRRESVVCRVIGHFGRGYFLAMNCFSHERARACCDRAWS